MNILLLNTSFPPMARSAATLFYELGCYLVDKGHHVSVVTEIPWRRLGPGGITPQYQNVRFRFHEVMAGMPLSFQPEAAPVPTDEDDCGFVFLILRRMPYKKEAESNLANTITIDIDRKPSSGPKTSR